MAAQLCQLSYESTLQAAKDLHITEGSSKVSGALYMAGKEHLDLLLEAYGIYSHTNPLHTDVWPSMRQLESDVIAMTASMLGGQCRHSLACVEQAAKQQQRRAIWFTLARSSAPDVIALLAF